MLFDKVIQIIKIKNSQKLFLTIQPYPFPNYYPIYETLYSRYMAFSQQFIAGTRARNAAAPTPQPYATPR